MGKSTISDFVNIVEAVLPCVPMDEPPKVRTSNIINDPVLFEKFRSNSAMAAREMYRKYYFLQSFCSVEDIVQEMWVKIIHQDISFRYDSVFDDKRFLAFCFMIASSVSIDLGKRKRRLVGEVEPYSLEGDFIMESDSTLALYCCLEDTQSTQELRNREFQSALYSAFSGRSHVKYPQLTTYKMLTCLIDGDNLTNLARTMGISSRIVLRYYKTEMPFIIRTLNRLCDPAYI